MVIGCLHLATTNRHQSIAFPVLGTGKLGYPGNEAAKGMLEPIIDYAQKVPNSSIRVVKIVIYHQDFAVQKVGFRYINVAVCLQILM